MTSQFINISSSNVVMPLPSTALIFVGQTPVLMAAASCEQDSTVVPPTTVVE
jgi:hypothetical protein